ncbi:hypothetical protein EJ06DRAFT_189449 [Trichodelitschia bisporula]|uniref:Uncharacterized protein n=1 Tax=Trichodelitschia bisporula TaxID=703511 RepID=A0A6G1I7I6_9PEZI|nr:hypothetical protein EJ06DRAFT_189449 [Trichodelitschia bisporula]
MSKHIRVAVGVELRRRFGKALEGQLVASRGCAADPLTTADCDANHIPHTSPSPSISISLRMETSPSRHAQNSELNHGPIVPAANLKTGRRKSQTTRTSDPNPKPCDLQNLPRQTRLADQIFPSARSRGIRRAHGAQDTYRPLVPHLTHSINTTLTHHETRPRVPRTAPHALRNMPSGRRRAKPQCLAARTGG